ncbi:unnamed protein product [Hermetia illucens]|uniref:Glycine-rich protein n=1 Tax=Hermetia illucens TaxID=343691 RepID=A0A7R8UZV1_HERIL|nr:glycine-rich selenoprotein-like [Hermetia illucens]CAD7090072.1 unnamed protein product [Hermetia illucens]
MVYISSDGQVYTQQPWTMQRFFGLFTGFFAFLMAFFRTLVDPLMAIGDNNNWSRGSGRGDAGGFRRGGGGGGGGGGGNGGGRPGGGGGGGPRIGRIMRMSDIRIPGGGCAGGSCGL